MYYYLAASLPAVTLDAPPPMTLDAFRDTCARHLSPSDNAALDALLTGDDAKTDHPFVRAWRHRETQLRCTLARLRAARQHRDATPYLRDFDGYDVSLEHAASDAFLRGTPLDREQALDRARWKVIEELAGHDTFSGSAILAYALKLKTAIRWAAMDEKAGQETTESLLMTKPDAETDTFREESNDERSSG